LNSRSLQTEEFDNYVRASLHGRAERIIERTNRGVSILPIFGEKLQVTNLISSKIYLSDIQ